MKQSSVLSICVATTLASNLVAGTLTFQAKTASSGTYFMNTASNWEQGRVPADGDDLYFGCWVSGFLGANNTAYVKSLTFNEWFYCNGISYSGFYVQSGGKGIVFEKKQIS